uniref:DUF4149 domain-containing protein n=1 Tax=Acidobacterium capsulatum TaxID=33075 RepID=A0A7V4XTI8_9BACT
MRTLLRALIFLLLILWIGGMLFFPIVAATAFGSLPDAHLAGTVTGKCLRILHQEGLISGVLLLILLAAAQRVRAFSHNVIAPMVLVAVMIGLTAYSQFVIIPHMETDRISAGGAIEAASPANPYRKDFDRLHALSVNVFGGVLICGLVSAVAIAWASGSKSPAA